MQALASLSGSQWSLHSCACLAPLGRRRAHCESLPQSRALSVLGRVRGVPGVTGDDGERAF